MVQATKQPSNPLKFSLSPRSGDIGSRVNISGNVTMLGGTSITGDTVKFYFGNNSTQIASAIVQPANTTYGTFKTSFTVPLVDSGKYTIFANDTVGIHSNQPFTVTYGVDNLISTLKELQTDQNSDHSNFTAIINLINQLKSTDQGVNSQLTSVNQAISSLGTSFLNSNRTIQSLVSASNNDIQSLYPLLIVFVALEGLLIGMVVVLIMLFVRRKSPGTRPDDVEIIDSWALSS